jgi:hypothetical protein
MPYQSTGKTEDNASKNSLKAKLRKTLSMDRHVTQRIREASEILRTLGYLPEPITVREFLDYLTGETLTGDTTTPEDILANDYLMIHELVEISELKRQEIPVDTHTMKNHSYHTYAAHLIATDWEFSYAVTKGDTQWLQKRLTIATCWFDDPFLPQTLEPQYRRLLQKYSRALKTSPLNRTE